MAQTQLSDAVSQATARNNSINVHLRREAAFKAASLRKIEAERRRLQQEQAAKNALAKAERLALALRGVGGLCRFGITPEFKKLMKARHDKPLIIYGGEEAVSAGGDMGDIWWKQVGYIAMTATELQIICNSQSSNDFGVTYKPHIGAYVSIELNYATSTKKTRSAALEPIATIKALDWERIRRDGNSMCERLSIEALFEILVQCGDSKKRSKLLTSAISDQ
jgi:hypothetical protein